jgi:hypothetical protein
VTGRRAGKLSRSPWYSTAAESIVLVKDRDEPIAQLGPPEPGPLTWRDRLAGEGRLRRGTQDWSTLEISKLDRPVDIQAALRAVREDPREVRRARSVTRARVIQGRR